MYNVILRAAPKIQCPQSHWRGLSDSVQVLLQPTRTTTQQAQRERTITNNPPELMEFLWTCKNTLISMPVPPFHVEFWNEKLGLNYFWINEIAASTRDAHKLHASVVPHIDLTSLLPMWVSNLYKPFKNFQVQCVWLKTILLASSSKFHEDI